MPAIPELVMTPREAFFSLKKRVSLDSSKDKIVGEFIIPFPPDIPIILPGERMNKEILEYIKYLRENDTVIIGPKDKTIKTIEIIEKQYV